MAATSVTGTGIGESFGEPKPENNSGCCANCNEETVKKKVIKNGCYVSYKISGSKSVNVCRSSAIRVC